MARTAQAAGAEKPVRTLWLQGLLCGALIVAFPAIGLLLGVLLAPGLAAILVDRSNGRVVARIMLLMGLTVAGHAVAALWHSGHMIAGSFELIGNLRLVVASWTAQACGWLLAELAPAIAAIVLETKARGRIARLRARRAAHEDEWSLPPSDQHDRPVASP